MEDKLGRVQDPGYNPGENLKQERRGEGADSTETPPALGAGDSGHVHCEQRPCRAGRVVPLLLSGEAEHLAWGLTWCHIEAIGELPARTGGAGSAAGDPEGGEHRAALGAQGTAGGCGRGHGAQQEPALPVTSLGPACEWREQESGGSEHSSAWAALH